MGVHVLFLAWVEDGMDVESEIRDLKRRVGELEGTHGFLTGQLRDVHRAVLGFQDQTNDRFDRVDARFEGVEERLDHVDARLERGDERLERLEAGMGKLDGRMGKLESGMSRIDKAVDELPKALAEIVRAEFARRDSKS
jgi:chromosome segregation ATPase